MMMLEVTPIRLTKVPISKGSRKIYFCRFTLSDNLPKNGWLTEGHWKKAFNIPASNLVILKFAMSIGKSGDSILEKKSFSMCAEERMAVCHKGCFLIEALAFAILSFCMEGSFKFGIKVVQA